MPDKTFTTHDIAKFCDVYPSSVVHWINGGKLKAYQTAGGHHRVGREDLLAFLRGLNIPIPAELTARSRRVLIVEDDAEMARVLERAFSRDERNEVQVCGDGIDALIRIGQEPPHLVILDLSLPKMDGLQVCRVLKSKEETRGVRVVAISGKKLAMSEKKLAECGIDAFFRKPLDFIELLAKSGELLGSAPAPSGKKASVR